MNLLTKCQGCGENEVPEMAELCGDCESQAEIEKDAAVFGRPLGDRILVRRFQVADRTAGGILLPDKAQEIINKGMVIKLGDGTEGPITLVKAGQVVMWNGFGGTCVDEAESLFVVAVIDCIYAE